MFCSKCGMKLSEESLFCFKCGEQTVNSSTKVVVLAPDGELQNFNNTKYSIKEYMTYAKNLEINRHTLQKAISRLQDKINTLGIPRFVEKTRSKKSDFFKAFGMILGAGAPLIFTFALIKGFIDGEEHYESIIISGYHFLFLVALIGGMIAFFLKKASRKKQYSEQLKLEDDRMRLENQQIVTLKHQQDELNAVLANTEVTMKRLYSLNVIYPKYREIVPIITMWEYIDSGRCLSLAGVDGAYNLYERESRQDIIISNLNQAVSMLQQIRDTQFALYEAIKESHDIAERMYRQSEQLLATCKYIERNSEITSYNAKIAAQNSTISAYIDFFKI